VTADALSPGGRLFRDGHWAAAYETLSAAEPSGDLPARDVAALAECAHLLGRDEECIAVSERAYHRFLAAGEHRVAARAAFWVAFTYGNTGEPARSAGWAARARTLVEEHRLGGSEEAHLVAFDAHGLLVAGRVEAAVGAARRAESLGLAVSDPDVVALARLTLAWADLGAGRRASALVTLDEVMVAVSSGEVAPSIAGLLYCSVVGACIRLRDLDRAAEWTSTFTGWCAARPDLVPYRGVCLVDRATVLTLRGDWATAVDDTVRACAQLPGHLAGDAHYARAELDRLAGRFDLAEAGYRRANRAGRQPEPGLSLLRIAQGRADRVVVTLRRLCAEDRAPADRADLLAAAVAAHLAVSDLGGAREAADALAEIAATLDAPMVRGLADDAAAAVALAGGSPAEALISAERACRTWRALEMPHHGARTRVLMARCLRALGDDEGATLELEAARAVFEQLGARPDLKAVEDLTGRVAQAPGSLTPREIEVVRLLARGLSNRAISAELVLSEKTVARHLSNIYAKLDLTSRSGATAYAYDHGLL